MGRMIKSEKPHKRLVCVAFRDIWQGQKDSNPRHVVLEEFRLPAQKWRICVGFAIGCRENTTEIRRIFLNSAYCIFTLLKTYSIISIEKFLSSSIVAP